MRVFGRFSDSGGPGARSVRSPCGRHVGKSHALAGLKAVEQSLFIGFRKIRFGPAPWRSPALPSALRLDDRDAVAPAVRDVDALAVPRHHAALRILAGRKLGPDGSRCQIHNRYGAGTRHADPGCRRARPSITMCGSRRRRCICELPFGPPDPLAGGRKDSRS